MKKSITVFIVLLFSIANCLPAIGQSSPALSIQFKNAENGPNSLNNPTIKPHLRIENEGITDVNLSDITMRYWFSKDGAGHVIANCLTSDAGCASTSTSIHELATPVAGADAYLEISFTSGTIQPGQRIDTKSRIERTDGQGFDETNDHSFAGLITNHIDNDHVTLYWQGNLIMGEEPVSGGLPTEEEEEASPGIISLASNSANEGGFNPQSLSLQFNITESEFSLNPDGYYFELNGTPFFPSNVSVIANQLSFSVVLANGVNELFFMGVDSADLMLSKSVTLLGGGASLFVNVVDEGGAPIDGATVKLTLSDLPEIFEEKQSVSGSVSFSHVPNRTMIITAQTSDNKFGSTAEVGGGFVTLTLKGFNPPSPIANNDISQGTLGWDIGTSSVQVIPHVEGGGGAIGGGIANNIPIPDQDLKLNTTGEGPRTMSRTFTSQAGTKSIRVRYRFVTSEVPGGFFGSQFNDYFSVKVRSQSGGGAVDESNSMNGLGLAAFDGSGATAWREVNLPLTVTGDIVQVDITVANVGDGLYDSYVVVDLIEEKNITISELVLNDIDDTPLNYLSLGTHPFFDGKTRVHGTITIEGPETDALTSLRLEVLKGGSVVAVGSIPASLESSLYTSFGTDEKISVSTSQLLFEIPGSGSYTQNGSVQLRVIAESQEEGTTSKEAGSKTLLALYPNTNRYLERNVNEGGDGWGRPNLISLVSALPSSWTFGDFSNMNGGKIAPHETHRDGIDVDGDFAAYDARNAATAEIFLNLLNGPLGSKINLIYVTYAKIDGNPFYDAIKGVNLTDGRVATKVLRSIEKHTGHFHLRINPNASNSPNPSRFGRNVYPPRTESNLEKQVHIHLYPNPAPVLDGSSTVQLEVDVPQKGMAQVVVLDLQGRVIQTLAHENVPKGKLVLEWDGSTQTGQTVTAGTYLVKAVLPGVWTPVSEKITVY